MTFEDWFDSNEHASWDNACDVAREAWDCQQAKIEALERWISGIADDHPQIPDWIQQSARSLLAQEVNGERVQARNREV
jgi:hypothetical protein